MSGKVTVEVYDAMGGPEMSSMAPDGFEAGPTTPGEYRIAYCGRHASRRYPDWSKIPWGSALKDEGGELWVMYEGRWQRLFDVIQKTRDDVMTYYEQLYNVRKIPDQWVFNDFGHATCYFFQDKNANRRFDPKIETIQSQFFHSTPVDEALEIRGEAIKLRGSHGCIHLKPAAINDMIKRRFMQRGTLVVIHGYMDRKVIFPRRGSAHSPYELHFFPAMNKLLVIGIGY